MPVPLKVLLVEDSSVDAQLTLQHLTNGGFAVTAERTDDAAGLRTLMGRRDWDVVICEFQLPAFGALAALEVVQATGQDIPFLVVAGEASETAAVTLLKSGAHDFITKENLWQLAPAVERELREAATRRERTEAARALQRSDARLRAAQRIAHLGHWEYKFAGDNKLEYWSDETYHIFGLSPQSGPLDKARFESLLHPDDRARFRREIDEAFFVRQQPFAIDYRIIRPDGSVRDLHDEGEPMLDGAGTVVGMQGVIADITERKAAEDKLREREALYRRLVESTNQGYYAADHRSLFTYCNAALLAMGGFEPGELIGVSSFRLVAEEDRPRVIADYRRWRADPAVADVTCEFRVLAKTGRRFWVEQSTHFERDAQGAAREGRNIVRDITERKLADDKLRESEHHYRSLVENINQGYYVATRQSILKYVNPAIALVTGYSEAELLAMSSFRLICAEDRPAIVRAYQEWTKSTITDTSLEFRVETKSGRRFWVEQLTRFVRDANGRLLETRNFIRDIDGRKAAEEALRASERRYQRVVENIGDALMIYDVAGHVVFGNDRFLEMFGVSREDLPTLAMDDYIAPEYRAIIRERHQRRIRGEEVSSMVQLEGLRKDRSRVWLEVRVSKVVEKGEFAGTQIALRDISDRQGAEHQLNRQLRHLDAIGRISRLSETATSLEDLLGGALGELLEIFQADRAWLLTPCDPLSPTWRVPMERTRPEWPGAFALGQPLPMTPELADLLREMLAADGALAFGPAARPVPASIVEQFSVQSQLQIVVRPKLGEAWVLGFHHCAAARTYDLDEHRLLEEIAGRLGDSLSSLLSLTQIRESEEKFRGVFDQSPVIMALLTVPEGRIVEVNDAAVASLGYTREEGLGRTSVELDLWVDAAAREHYLQMLRAKGSVQGFEAVMRRKDGSLMTVLYSGSLIVIAGRTYSLNSLQDISARKAAEEALRASEQRYVRVVGNISDGLLIDDVAGNLVFANDRFLAMFGLTRADLPGLALATCIAPEYRAAISERHRQRMAGEDVPAIFRYEGLHRDGTRLWLEVRVSTIVEHGVPAGTQAAVRDITREIAAEELRLKAERQLREAQKMESLGTLAGGIAHDFNNILTGLLGYVELARLDLPAPHPARQWIDGITASGTRAKELVRQILTFSRKSDGERAPLRLQSVVLEAVKLLRSTLPAMVQVDEAISPLCPFVQADATQIHQVMMNLGTNAWHALPPAGGRIKVTLAPWTVDAAQAATHAGLKPGAFVRLTVEDNGCGMAPAVAERIFEPFFTTKETGKGTGLGLAVVHGIVQSHGGTILVHSTPGFGTVFELFFPVPSAVASGPAAAAPAQVPSGSGQRILLVDDDDTSRGALVKMLEHLHYRVRECASPVEALALFQRDPQAFDLLLTDLAMPRLQGDELARRCRTARPNLPVVLASGFIDDAKMRALVRQGPLEILRKPASVDELARAIVRALQPVQHDSGPPP